jgi:hypothetical protein
MARRETYTIHLDGGWSLEDLYKFPRTYEQVYFFINAVEIVDDHYFGEEVDHIFRSFPWNGGYSAVGFYNSLKYRTSVDRRPKIISMQYASPGWIELGLIESAAKAVEHIVKTVAHSIDHINATYNSIRKGISDRKLADIKVKREQLILDREELEFLQHSAETLSQMMGLNNLAELHEKTGDPLISLKILLSLYRRVRMLAAYQLKGKVDFSNSRQWLGRDT